MSNYKKITKKQYDAAYNQHLPNSWIKFAYKHFSKETEKKDMSLKNHLSFILLSLFIIAFFSTVFNAPHLFILILTLSYSILLSALVLYLFSAVFLNNYRLKKIRKILGVNKFEYNYLAGKYYKG